MGIIGTPHEEYAVCGVQQAALLALPLPTERPMKIRHKQSGVEIEGAWQVHGMFFFIPGQVTAYHCSEWALIEPEAKVEPVTAKDMENVFLNLTLKAEQERREAWMQRLVAERAEVGRVRGKNFAPCPYQRSVR